MTTPGDAAVRCSDDLRRRQVRKQGGTGLDWIEPEEDRRVLRVGFLGRAPLLTPAHIRIEGGRRITGLTVVGVRWPGVEDADRDDELEVTVDRVGDLSPYTLRLVEGGDELLEDVDRRYRALEFSFVAGCPSDLECLPAEDCPPPATAEPELSYLAKDYASFRQLILDRLALIMPGWTERHVPDIGITLVELLAYVGDYLSYHQDAVATEAYLGTARRRISVRRHVRLVDYRLHDGCNARAWVCLEAAHDATLPAGSFFFVTGRDAAETGATSGRLPAGVETGGHAVFEPMGRADVRVRRAHNTIRFWTWGNQECVLAAGATRATLRDEWVTRGGKAPGPRSRALDLRAGDVLVIEEVLGPCTGVEADADPGHRQPVRLMQVVQGVDPVFDQPVVEIAWAPEDALDFPLCLSTVARPECEVVEPCMARGNVVLADHGQSVTSCGQQPEFLDAPQVVEEPGGCAGAGDPLDPVLREQWLDRRLGRTPLTCRTPYPPDGQVGRAQAARLAAIPGRFLARLRDLWRQAASGTALTAAQIEEVRVVYPDRVLTLVRFPLPEPRTRRPVPAEAQAAALGRLLAEPRLVAARTRWLADLARRARAGLVLSEDQVAEIREAWGPAYAEGLDRYDAALAGAARGALVQDPAGALPALELSSRTDGTAWTVRPDLLRSGPDAADVVVEVDDEGMGHLRFGDGEVGRRPAPGTGFLADYRVGNGTAGNVGAGVIDQVVFCQGDPGVITSVANPLPATGGVDPQTVAEARLLAPGAFRRRIERAVTAEDYAEVARRHPGLQDAAARLRWTGSWYDAEVVVDPRGTDEPGEDLVEHVRETIFRYRRVGHGLTVERARYVPLVLGLRVCVLPHHARDRVRARLLDLFGSRQLPDGQRGFFHPDALTFGTDIETSRLVALARSVPGVETVEVRRLERLGEGNQGELERGFLRLGPFEIPQLDNDVAQPEKGRLDLEMGGGR